MTEAKLLVVDDEPNIRELLAASLRFNGFEVEIPISDHVLMFIYRDRPGVVGQLGQVLGENGINIAGMQVARRDDGEQALCLLSVDSAVPHDVLATVGAAIGAVTAREVDLQE